MKRLVSAAVVLAALLGLTFGTGLAAVLTIDTFPFWPSTGGYFMLTGSATGGQVVTAPAGASEINSFSFQMNNPPTNTFRGYVYAWDGSKATGLPLYESGDRNNSGEPEVVTFDTGHVQVTPGAQYVLFVSTSEFSGLGIGNLGAILGSDAYAGGLRVWLSNGADVAAWTSSNWRLIQDNSDLAVSAHFTAPDSTPCFSLVTTVTPLEGGQVDVSPSPNCTVDPTKYASGTVVTLAAAADSYNGYTFSGWSGDASGTANTTTLTMNGDKVVTANFSTFPCYTLTSAANPETGGGINVSPSPNCATDPNKYTQGTVVTLTAWNDAYHGYAFSGWSGDASGATNPTTVTMNGNRSVTANFVRPCFVLSLGSNPANAGSVAVDPAPNCTSETGKYVAGTSVSLTATANAGYLFSGWSGNADGSSNPLTVWVGNGDKNVTANFDPFPCFSVTATSNPSNGGSVAVSPAANCVTDGSKYAAGSELTFMATANPGYTFSGWSGDLSGIANPATVSVWMGTSARSVTASFTGAPELAITDFTVAQTRAGSRSFNLTWTVANQGPLTAPGVWKDTVYLSADATFGPGDTILKKSTRQRESLATDANYSEKMRVNLPQGDPRRYLILRADDENTVAESDEGNNMRVFQITVPVMADAPDEADGDLP